ncbi:MAG: F0F1 ATP synthase subunit alpha [Candidatus Paceibacterota bacterium]
MSKFKENLKKTQEIGRITSINYSIVRVSGLPDLNPNEMIVAEGGQQGIAYNLERDHAEILMLDTEALKTKQRVTRTNESFKIGVNSNLRGRIIDPLCRPVDKKGPITGKKNYQGLENPAPNITEREVVKEPLQTGVSRVDLLVPLGHGQRELILGDTKIGKTTFLLQTIANQVRQGTTCIYVSIGKRASDLKQVENYFSRMGISDRVILMRAGAGEPSPLLYLAPYSGMSIAEHFRDRGENVLIVFDDLTTHAKIYRELSLLLERPPGRSSYPGDVFHVHASLLERAGNVKSEQKEASITALPVANTQENDISGYIQTNLMAITDGHIFFDSDKFRKGINPAIDIFLSVSRVGNQTKSRLDRELAQQIRRKMSDYNRALEISQFGVELPEKTRNIISFGKKLEKIFTQPSDVLFSREFQLLLVGLLLVGYWKEDSPAEVDQEVARLTERYQQEEFSDLEQKIQDIEDSDKFKRLVKNSTSQVEEF